MDWDYHMRLAAQWPEPGSLIHFHHFRHWRVHGVAHELRNAVYGECNRSMLSSATGRTKDFKDRCAQSMGSWKLSIRSAVDASLST